MLNYRPTTARQALTANYLDLEVIEDSSSCHYEIDHTRGVLVKATDRQTSNSILFYVKTIEEINNAVKSLFIHKMRSNRGHTYREDFLAKFNEVRQKQIDQQQIQQQEIEEQPITVDPNNLNEALNEAKKLLSEALSSSSELLSESNKRKAKDLLFNILSRSVKKNTLKEKKVYIESLEELYKHYSDETLSKCIWYLPILKLNENFKNPSDEEKILFARLYLIDAKISYRLLTSFRAKNPLLSLASGISTSPEATQINDIQTSLARSQNLNPHNPFVESFLRIVKKRDAYFYQKKYYNDFFQLLQNGNEESKEVIKSSLKILFNTQDIFLATDSSLEKITSLGNEYFLNGLFQLKDEELSLFISLVMECDPSGNWVAKILYGYFNRRENSNYFSDERERFLNSLGKNLITALTTPVITGSEGLQNILYYLMRIESVWFGRLLDKLTSTEDIQKALLSPALISENITSLPLALTPQGEGASSSTASNEELIAPSSVSLWNLMSVPQRESAFQKIYFYLSAKFPQAENNSHSSTLSKITTEGDFISLAATSRFHPETTRSIIENNSSNFLFQPYFAAVEFFIGCIPSDNADNRKTFIRRWCHEVIRNRIFAHLKDCFYEGKLKEEYLSFFPDIPNEAIKDLERKIETMASLFVSQLTEELYDDLKVNWESPTKDFYESIWQKSFSNENFINSVNQLAVGPQCSWEKFRLDRPAINGGINFITKSLSSPAIFFSEPYFPFRWCSEEIFKTQFSMTHLDEIKEYAFLVLKNVLTAQLSQCFYQGKINRETFTLCIQEENTAAFLNAYSDEPLYNKFEDLPRDADELQVQIGSQEKIENEIKNAVDNFLKPLKQLIFQVTNETGFWSFRVPPPCKVIARIIVKTDAYQDFLKKCSELEKRQKQLESELQETQKRLQAAENKSEAKQNKKKEALEKRRQDIAERYPQIKKNAEKYLSSLEEFFNSGRMGVTEKNLATLISSLNPEQLIVQINFRHQNKKVTEIKTDFENRQILFKNLTEKNDEIKKLIQEIKNYFSIEGVDTPTVDDVLEELDSESLATLEKKIKSLCECIQKKEELTQLEFILKSNEQDLEILQKQFQSSPSSGKDKKSNTKTESKTLESITENKPKPPEVKSIKKPKKKEQSSSTVGSLDEVRKSSVNVSLNLPSNSSSSMSTIVGGAYAGIPMINPIIKARKQHAAASPKQTDTSASEQTAPPSSGAESRVDSQIENKLVEAPSIQQPFIPNIPPSEAAISPAAGSENPSAPNTPPSDPTTLSPRATPPSPAIEDMQSSSSETRPKTLRSDFFRTRDKSRRFSQGIELPLDVMLYFFPFPRPITLAKIVMYLAVCSGTQQTIREAQTTIAKTYPALQMRRIS